MYMTQIRRSVIGREKDVLRLIFKKSKDGDKSYTMREGVLGNFLEDDGLGKIDLNQKILNLSDEPVDVELDEIPNYLQDVRDDENLMNMIELREPDNRVIFVLGCGKFIKIHSGESNSDDDETIQRKFLFHSLELLFNLKLNKLDPNEKSESCN